MSVLSEIKLLIVSTYYFKVLYKELNIPEEGLVINNPSCSFQYSIL